MKENNEGREKPGEKFSEGRRMFIRNAALVILGVAANGTIVTEVLGETLRSPATAPSPSMLMQGMSFTNDQINVMQRVFGSRTGQVIFVRAGAVQQPLYGLSGITRSRLAAEQRGTGVRIYFNEQQRAKLRELGVKSCDFVDIPDKSALSQNGSAVMIAIPAAR